MVRSRLTYVLFCVATLGAAAPIVAAQASNQGIPPSRLFPQATFDPTVPTQKDVIGFHPGAQPLRHVELMRYLEALAEASPHAVLQHYSRTHEDRPMVVMIVSDEATIGRLEDFKLLHAARTDPRGRSPEQDEKVLADAKAVAWMAYGIHGDELSSVDAAAALAYWLVAGEDERARQLRRDLLILIDPCENPDGRERFLTQTTSFAHASPNPDPEDLSHTTVWPWGRGNHYLFDLNRDWFSMVQPESRRSEVIASWNPQLMVDSHEMGSDNTYLFSPPRHPFNPHIPEYEWAWSDRFAADQAKALDARGYAYYTREWNEEFFPGYGSSWASYLGAIGILYEMSSTEGTLVRKKTGIVRTYGQAVEHQVTSSVANLGTTADNRAELLRDFVDGRRKVIRRAGQGVAAWVLTDRRNPERVGSLVWLLRRQGIEVLRAETSPPNVSGLRDARTGASASARDLPAETWLVPTDQPAGALVRVLLDPHVPMSAEFFREEREYQERDKGTRLYETTAWSLPLAYAIDAYWTSNRPSTGWSEKMPVTPPRGVLETAPQLFGYLMHGTADPSIPALADMLQRGLRARVAEKPFRVDGHRYDRGAILLVTEENPDDLTAQLAEISSRWGVNVRGVSTAKSEQGPDLGGEYFHKLVAPRIGVWSGAPVSPPDYGALWYMLDMHLELRFSGLDLSRFDATDLARYNVLVFPTVRGGAGAYRELLGDEGLERLGKWIDAGGTAIGIGNGAQFLADEDNELTDARLRRQVLERHAPVVLGPSAEEVAAGGAFHAVGVLTPADDENEDAGKTTGDRESLYDVAPLLGPGAAPFARGHEQGTAVSLDPVHLVDWVTPLLPPNQDEPTEEDLERADERLRRFATRGSFLRIELDHDRWLTWGADEELPAFVRGSTALIAEPPVQVAARFADLDRLHIGGLLWPETAGRVAHTAYATREANGRGQVILFVSEPEFRGWTLGTRRLLLNALLYGPGLGTDWSAPW